jgi:signal peptidase complex subunit 3
LNSYNTKQLFLYLTASFTDQAGVEEHDVVLWDRIVTRGDVWDFRTVDQKSNVKGDGKEKGKGKQRKSGSKKGRGNVRVEEGKNKYTWTMPSGSFK